MRAGCGVLVVWILLSGATAAQDRTSDGVIALVRGDYARAADILRPLAEDNPNPDPLAQFFMAMLYERGMGVPGNTIRACGLYLKASRTPHPLMAQSLVLAEEFSKGSALAERLCSEAAEWTWREPEPARFTLGPDHSVQIDRRGLTVEYQGSPTTVPMQWGGPDWVFLLTRHTPLDIGPGKIRRHFIEFFVWTPYTVLEQRMWGLAWFAHEIVGSNRVEVPGDGAIATAAGPQPPEFSVDDVARIVVNADGQVERIVESGPHARRVLVPDRSGK